MSERDDYLNKEVPEDNWYDEDQINDHLIEDDHGNMVDAKTGEIVWEREYV